MAIIKTSEDSNNSKNCNKNTKSIDEGFNPETLYFEDFDGTYYEEPEEYFGDDYFSYVSDCSSDISSTAENSIYSTDSSISTHESDNFLSLYSHNESISACALPNKDEKKSMKLNINTTEKFFNMTPKDYRISLINFYKQKIGDINGDFSKISN
ncbi:8481_t:CDS:1 [Ambispora leptoticha]|uniref:8481_t:CDS:1 n=1 Tax=Ambispora leptoticha TaxID=144679 RepID=A0A9N9CST6_9GLOM|nr:8481_t:CDS:1 [Ambispora leptoticha]